MSNPYFTKSGYPATSARAVSASLRAEIANIEAGFDKLPTLSGNGGKAVVVNSGATALAASKVTITEPASSATITIADGKTLTVSDDITLNRGSGALAISNAVNWASGPTLQNSVRYFRVGEFVVVFAAVLGSLTASSTTTSFDMAAPINSTPVGGEFDWTVGAVAATSGGDWTGTFGLTAANTLSASFTSTTTGSVLVRMWCIYRIS